MPSPDVRVRLSAEGTAEVVAALKKVQAEAVAASRATGAAASKGAGGVGSLVGALGGLKGLLGAAGIAFGVQQLTSQIRGLAAQTLDTSGRLADLSESFGTSGANLSTLAAVGAKSGVSIEQLGKALSKTAVLTTEFENGSASAARTMKALGVTLGDLKGKDTAERFAIIAQQLSKMRDSAAKANLVIDAFGEKLGARFIPLINEVGTKGIKALREELEKLGFVMSDQVIANVDRLGDTLARSQGQIVVLASTFLAGAAAPIVDGLEQMQGALGTTKDLWSGLGTAIGYVIRQVVLVAAAQLPLLNLFDALGTSIGVAAIKLDAFFRISFLNAKGRFAEASAIAKLVEETVDQSLERARKRMVERFDISGKALKSLFHGAVGVSGGEPDVQTNLDLAERERQQSELARKMLDLDRSVTEARLQLQEKADKRAFEAGLITLEAYYAKRRGFVEEALNAELDFIKRRRNQDLDKAATPAERKGINAAAGETSGLKRSQAADQNAELDVQFVEDKLQLAGRVLELQRESLSLFGREKEIQAATLALKVAAHRLDAERRGFKGAELDAETALFEKGLKLADEFNGKLEAAQRAMADFQQARAAVQRDALNSRLSEVAAAEKLVQFDRDRLPQLQEFAAALSGIAGQSGNLDFEQRAEGFARGVQEIGQNIENASLQIRTFRQNLEASFESGLTSFLTEGILQARNLEDAFHSLARSIIADLQAIYAKRVATQLSEGLFGLFSGGLSSAQQTQVHAGRMAFFADGGFVAGPGTGRSDSVPAMLSRGEFVMQSSIVNQPGVAELLMNLNNGHQYDLRPPSFAPIQYDDGDFGGGGSSSVSGAITVAADEGSTITHLDTPAGQKVVLKHIVNNRRAIGRILGGR